LRERLGSSINLIFGQQLILKKTDRIGDCEAIAKGVLFGEQCVLQGE